MTNLRGVKIMDVRDDQLRGRQAVGGALRLRGMDRAAQTGRLRSIGFALALVAISLTLAGWLGHRGPESLQIVKQPADLTVAPGRAARFTVDAGGDDLSFQWQRNGKDIAGADRDELVLPVVTAQDDYSLINVVVRRGQQVIASSRAVLRVTDVPIRDAQGRQHALMFKGERSASAVVPAGQAPN